MRKDDIMSQGYQPSNPTWYQQPRSVAPSQPLAVPASPAPAARRPEPRPVNVKRHPAPARAAAPRLAPAVRRSRLLLAACVIATLALIYTVWYMISTTGSALRTDDAFQGLGAVIAVGLATPFAVVSGIATIFAWVGYGTQRRGFVLAAGILFSVAIVLMFVWFFMDIVQMILCYVSYARMKKARTVSA